MDGDYQNCKAKGGAWTRENFFGRDPEALKLVETPYLMKISGV